MANELTWQTFGGFKTTPLANNPQYGITNLINTPITKGDEWFNNISFNDVTWDGINIDDKTKESAFNSIINAYKSGGSAAYNNGQLQILDANGKINNTFGTLNPSAMDKAAQGMSIFGSTMQGLNSLSQIGLGWANYAENRERLKQLNELTKEQIASSREMREQRRKEIERLNKARTYTKNAYGKGTTITRSVM